MDLMKTFKFEVRSFGLTLGHWALIVASAETRKSIFQALHTKNAN